MNKKFVWIGAGAASYPKVNFDDFGSIVLVDARKEACDELNEHFKDNAKVTTKQVCISERNGESVFFQCNVEELSALAKPAQLKSLYPGLRVNSYDVDTVSISDFLSEELLDGGIELFIDTPATSWLLVRELFKNKFLDSITKLHVSIGTVPALYEESTDLTELASLLKENFFEEVSRDSDDPDVLVVSFELNKDLKVIESLKAENSELQQQLIEARRHHDEIEHKANNLSSNLAVKSDLIEAKDLEFQALKKEMATYKAELQKKNVELRDSQSKLDSLINELAQLRLCIDQREREFEAYEKKIGELSDQLQSERVELGKQLENNSELITINEKVTKERDEANKWRIENKKWAESLVEEKALSEKKLSDYEKQVSSLESNVADITGSYNDIAIKEKNSARTLELNTKLMSKMQLDLDELRVQYKEKVQAEKAMHELIAELHSKLKQAQVFYRNLESQFPEIATATKDFD